MQPITSRVSAVLARTGVRHMGHAEPSAKLTVCATARRPALTRPAPAPPGAR